MHNRAALHVQDFLQAFLASDPPEDEREQAATVEGHSDRGQSTATNSVQPQGMSGLESSVPIADAVQSQSMDSVSAAANTAEHVASDTMFLSWDAVAHEQLQHRSAADAAAFERDLGEALTLLPDLAQLQSSIMPGDGDMLPMEFDLRQMMM